MGSVYTVVSWKNGIHNCRNVNAKKKLSGLEVLARYAPMILLIMRRGKDVYVRRGTEEMARFVER